MIAAKGFYLSLRVVTEIYHPFSWFLNNGTVFNFKCFFQKAFQNES